jgi:hypothetical protein
VERQRLAAEDVAEAERTRTATEIEAARQREPVAQIFTGNPELLRLRELEKLCEPAQVANARIYVGFPKDVGLDLNGVAGEHERSEGCPWPWQCGSGVAVRRNLPG